MGEGKRACDCSTLMHISALEPVFAIGWLHPMMGCVDTKTSRLIIKCGYSTAMIVVEKQPIPNINCHIT